MMNNRFDFTFRGLLALVFLTTVFVLTAGPAAAQTVWTDATGSWFLPANWSAGVPTAGTNAKIDNGGTAQVGAPGATVLTLTLGTNPGNSGTVTVDGAGTLSVANVLNVGLFGTGTLNITNGATVTTDVNAFIGTAGTGTGTVTVDGTGSTWTIGNGLYLAAGGAGGTGTLHITNGGAVSTTFQNVFIGDNNGGTGTVVVDGSLTNGGLGGVQIASGGTLTGNGTVTGRVTNGGVVAPGGSPGTLRIEGTFINNPNGTFRAEIGGLNEGVNADLLRVLGITSQATINGGTIEVIRFGGFNPSPGDRVTVIRNSEGRTGAFDTLVPIGWQGLIQPTDVYDNPETVDIVFQLAASFASQALTPNQGAVANNIDDAVNDPGAAALINFLGNQPLANLPVDFDLIAPEELAAMYEVGFSQAMVQNNNLERRMDDIRAGSNGFCANVFVAPSGKDFSKDSGGKAVLPANDGPQVYVPTENNRWGVFANGSGNFVNVGDEDFNAPGYEITGGNFTFGADYRVSDHFAIGINGGYANSQVDLVNGGNIDVDGGKIGAYATVFGKGFFGGRIYIDGAIGGGLNSYETLRIGLQNELVTGDTDGSEFNGMISYGSDWTFGCFNIGTWSTIQYTRVNIDEFTELGSLAPLEIQDQSEDSLRSTTGIRASYDIKAGRAIFRPELRVAWQHEHGDRGYQVDSRLASGAGGIFRVHGPEVGSDAALIGAGLNMQWNNRFATYVYYDGVLGRGNYDNNAVTGGLRIGF